MDESRQSEIFEKWWNEAKGPLDKNGNPGDFWFDESELRRLPGYEELYCAYGLTSGGIDDLEALENHLANKYYDENPEITEVETEKMVSQRVLEIRNGSELTDEEIESQESAMWGWSSYQLCRCVQGERTLWWVTEIYTEAPGGEVLGAFGPCRTVDDAESFIVLEYENTDVTYLSDEYKAESDQRREADPEWQKLIKKWQNSSNEEPNTSTQNDG